MFARKLSPNMLSADFGSPELRKKIVGPVIAGEKFISLAISEAFAGSDVAGLRCTATKTEDGKHFIINGTKKWITSRCFSNRESPSKANGLHIDGHFSDYFTVGCKTDKGLTVFLVERDDTVETKLLVILICEGCRLTPMSVESRPPILLPQERLTSFSITRRSPSETCLARRTRVYWLSCRISSQLQ